MLSHGSQAGSKRGSFTRLPAASRGSFGESVYSSPPELDARAAADSFLAGTLTNKRSAPAGQLRGGQGVVCVFAAVALVLIIAAVCTVAAATSAAGLSLMPGNTPAKARRGAQDGGAESAVEDLTADALIASRNNRLNGGSTLTSDASSDDADGKGPVDEEPAAMPLFQVTDDKAKSSTTQSSSTPRSTTGQKEEPDAKSNTSNMFASPDKKSTSSTAKTTVASTTSSTSAATSTTVAATTRPIETTTAPATTTEQVTTTVATTRTPTQAPQLEPEPLGPDGAGGSATATEANTGAEWKIVYESPDNSAVNVRSSKLLNSTVLGTKVRGEIFLGEREGEWVRLVCEPGYLKMQMGTTPLVTQRRLSFEVLESGSCDAAGMFSISAPDACAEAAASLGITISGAVTNTEEADSPEGCYLLASSDGASGNPSLQIGISPASWGAGASPGKSPICSTKAGTCDAVAATNARKPPLAGQPTLFCFAVLQGPEGQMNLLRAQFSKGVGIFACDAWSVYTMGRMRLNQGHLVTSEIPPPPAGWGPPVPWLSRPLSSKSNLDVLLGVWQKVVKDGVALQQDWIVKVHPDAMFLPSRLRGVLSKQGDALKPADDSAARALYLKNCQRQPDDPAVSDLDGPLKVLSGSAAKVLARSFKKCYDEVSWSGMGEGAFLAECLGALGVSGRGGAGGQDCSAEKATNPPESCDGSEVVYHPLPDRGSYFRCLAQTQRPQ